MVEGRGAPTRGGVANGAVYAQLAFMHIILRMAGITVGGRGLEERIGMAIIAGEADVFTGQFKTCRIVIEGGGDPAVRGVAGGASLAQLTLVNIVFCMAGITILRGCFHVRDAARAGMALRTRHLGMLACQWECCQAMVESLTIRIDPIMAAQAISSISLQVRLYETGFNLLVAGRTDGLVKFDIAVPMAIRAGKGASIHHGCVRGERITELVMVDLDFTHVGLGGIWTTMLRVAVPANQSGIILMQISVQCSDVSPLHGDIFMTGHAPVGHTGLVPERRMTAATLVAKLCMRGHTPQRSSTPGVEWTRVEEDAAGHQPNAGNYENGHCCGDASGSGQESNPLLFHLSPLSLLPSKSFQAVFPVSI